MHGQHLGGIENFIESVCAVGIDSEAVRFHIAVETQTDQKMLVVKESRPLLVYQHTVCLNAEIYAAAAQVIFFDPLGEVLEIVESGKQRLAALKRKSYTVPFCEAERAFYEPV